MASQKQWLQKRWKQRSELGIQVWELKSLSFDEVFRLVREVIAKQLDIVNKEEIWLDQDLETEYDADSVDIAGMLLLLEDLYKDLTKLTLVYVPTHLVREIFLVEDFFDVVYEVLVDMEQKLASTSSDLNMLKPDYEALARKKRVGYLYPPENTSGNIFGEEMPKNEDF